MCLRAVCAEVRPPVDKFSKEPFFIVGCPRSGTTLLQTLLDAHPHIAIPPESHLFVRFTAMMQCEALFETENGEKTFVKALLRDGWIKLFQLQIEPDEFLNRLGGPKRTPREMIFLLFRLYAEKQGKLRWGEKTPAHVFYLAQIKKLFPEAKIIHLVRDGRDVVESHQRTFVGPKSIDRIAKRWKNSIVAFCRFKETCQPSDYIEVQYEDLVSQPEDIVNQVLTFLGEEPMPLDYRLPDTRLKSFYLKNHFIHSSLSEMIAASKVGIYKKKLRQREIDIFESIAGECLSLYGYERSCLGKVTVTPVETARFFFENYGYRYLRKCLKPEVIRTDLELGWQLLIRNLWFTFWVRRRCGER